MIIKRWPFHVQYPGIADHEVRLEY